MSPPEGKVRPILKADTQAGNRTDEYGCEVPVFPPQHTAPSAIQREEVGQRKEDETILEVRLRGGGQVQLEPVTKLLLLLPPRESLGTPPGRRDAEWHPTPGSLLDHFQAGTY